jgi:hypothetical protein
MNFRDFILSEMLVHRLDDNPTRIIAFRGHLWLYENITEKDAKKVVNTILKEHPQRKKINTRYRKFSTNYSDDIEGWVRENVLDAFVGYWDAKKKTIWTSPGINPATSALLQKIANALKARSVEYETEQSFKPPYAKNDDREYWDSREKFTYKKMLGNISDVAYHGTTTEYLPSIFLYGLMPGRSASNYGDIVHDDKIFLSFSFIEAETHALHTAENKENWPVILQVRIPDKAALQPDYDVDKSTISPTYPDFTGGEPNAFSSVDSMKASRHAGLFGYKGRIPANFIEGAYLRIKNKWKKVRIDTLKRRVMADPWGWHYHYGM